MCFEPSPVKRSLKSVSRFRDRLAASYYALALTTCRRHSLHIKLQDIISICSEWPSDLPLDVGNIQRVAPFDKSLNSVSVCFGSPSVEDFTWFLQ